MSTIFTTSTTTTINPRPDATIRIQFVAHDSTRWNGEWRKVDLLEFHPDWDNRLKFRSVAHIAPQPDLTHEGLYAWYGVGYLEHPSIAVRETSIHKQDLRELYDYCLRHLQRQALIIHPCPLPFPLFKKGERVVAIGKDRWGNDRSGELATVIERSSQGGGTIIRFDKEEFNRGFTSIGFDSLTLRKADE